MRQGIAIGALAVVAGLIAFLLAPTEQADPTAGNPVEVAGALVVLTPQAPVDAGPRPYRVEVVADAPIREVVLLADGREVDRYEPAGDVATVQAVLHADGGETLDAAVTLDDGRTVGSVPVRVAPPPSSDDVVAEVDAAISGDTSPLHQQLATSVTWEGPGRIEGAVLEVDDPSVTRVFGYVSDDDLHWYRVPAADGTSLPLTRGRADLSGHLPALHTARIRFELWRDDPQEVAMLGVMRADGPDEPAAAAQALTDLGLTGRVTLGYLPRPGVRGVEEAVEQSAVVPADADEELWFRWDSDIPGVTHVMWQAFANGPPLGAPSPTAMGAHRIGIATYEDGGRFAFRPWLDESGEIQEDDPTAGNVGIAHDLLFPSSGTRASLDGPADTVQPIAGSVLTSRPGYVRAWYVRALAFAGDTYLGKASDVVSLYVTPESARAEGPAEGRFTLDVELLPPAPIDPQYATCFRVLGIDQTVRKEREAASLADDLDYAILDALLARHGSTLCMGVCYYHLQIDPPAPLPTLFKATLGSGDAKWSSNGNCGGGGGGGLLGALGGAVVGAVTSIVTVAGVGYDLAASTYNGAKQLALDVVIKLSGCEQIAGAATSDDQATSICRAAATTVVNGALASVGLPPELPDRQALIAGAKGDLKAALAELAASQGVPCDELAAASEVADTKGLTCEQIADRIVEDAARELAAAVRENASGAGMPFPPGVDVVQEPLAVAGPARLRVTATPEPGSGIGPTCDAVVMSSLEWTPEGFGALGARRSITDVGPDWFVPLRTYRGGYVWQTIQLPQPSSATTSATAEFTISPPVVGPPQQAFRWEWGLDADNQMGNVRREWDLPGEVLLLRPGAEMAVTLVSDCAATASATAVLGPVPELP